MRPHTKVVRERGRIVKRRTKTGDNPRAISVQSNSGINRRIRQATCCLATARFKALQNAVRLEAEAALDVGNETALQNS